jgi:flagellar basal-body rod protein FlgF
MISGSGINVMVNAATRQTRRLDSAVRNIANVDTTGFKAERLRFLEGSAGAGTAEGKPDQRPATTIDYSQGAMQKSGNVLDMAINGEGFLALQTKDGVAYTRDGRATLNENGELVSLTGEYILGRAGKITISGDDIQITENGAVRVDGNEVDTLKIVSFKEPSALIKLNARLYRNPDDVAGAREGEDPQVRSGCLELSNVQVIREMVEMINIQRTFESYQKTIQTIDEQDKASTSRIGKL